MNTKRIRVRRILSVTLGIVMCAGIILTSKVDTFAAHTTAATVQGTVCKGTTSDTLYLYNASNGKYTIKMDGDTNTSGCKVLTVGKTVTVTMCKLSDGSYHADVITVGNKAAGLTIDTSNKSTVTGTVQDATTDDILTLKTSSGNMQIKLENTTDFSGCNVLVSGKTVTVVCARGSDAYMHALSVNSGTTATTNTVATSTSSTSTTTTTSSVPANTIEVSGTPTSKSKDGELYLSTKDGTYYLVVDSSADTTGGFMFTSGNTVTAYIYRGDDANMHAAKVVGKRDSGATVGSSTTSFTGTVNDKSKESLLYLDTSGGTMEFKLDNSTTLSGVKGLSKGRSVTVTAASGSDSYWHAVSISANSK